MASAFTTSWDRSSAGAGVAAAAAPCTAAPARSHILEQPPLHPATPSAKPHFGSLQRHHLHEWRPLRRKTKLLRLLPEAELTVSRNSWAAQASAQHATPSTESFRVCCRPANEPEGRVSCCCSDEAPRQRALKRDTLQNSCDHTPWLMPSVTSRWQTGFQHL